MLVLIWACRVRGDPAGDERPATVTVCGGFWGLLVSEAGRGLKGPVGWSGGKDWALATRPGGESFWGGLNEVLGCRQKREEDGLWLCPSWPLDRCRSQSSQMQLKPSPVLATTPTALSDP